jgi:hypothetical protein
MIERHVTFHVLPDKARDFEELFAQAYRPAMAGMPGYVGAGLLRAHDEPTEYQMVIRFERGLAGLRRPPGALAQVEGPVLGQRGAGLRRGAVKTAARQGTHDNSRVAIHALVEERSGYCLRRTDATGTGQGERRGGNR